MPLIHFEIYDASVTRRLAICVLFYLQLIALTQTCWMVFLYWSLFRSTLFVLWKKRYKIRRNLLSLIQYFEITVCEIKWNLDDQIKFNINFMAFQSNWKKKMIYRCNFHPRRSHILPTIEYKDWGFWMNPCYQMRRLYSFCRTASWLLTAARIKR